MKLSDNVKKVLGAVAPTLGAVLGGPLGGLAGNILASKLGVDNTKDVEDAILNQSPETIAKIRLAEIELEKQIRENDIDLTKLEVEDRKDARQLAGKDMRPHIVLSTVFLGGYFTMLGLMMTGNIQLDPQFKTELSILFGVITANVPTIMAFWFGSSHGSQKKTDMLGSK